jgi:beta-N-acetylhexosaminidase
VDISGNHVRGLADMDAGRPGPGLGEDRRGLLRKMLLLGAAAPLAGASCEARTATADQRPALRRSRVPAVRRSRVPAGLSSRQMAGQRVVFSYPGLTVPPALLALITAGEAAGVIFFGDNISGDAQIASVIRQLGKAQQQSPVPAPLLLMTDQEGGEVRRLPGAPVLSEKQIGQSSNPATAAAQAGTGAGRSLASVGMNVNLAPVLDVFYQAGNFIDEYHRSYGSDVQTVTACGRAFVAAQQDTGVAATAKHFPGLGSATASQDTDTGPVTLAVPLSGLRSRDEAPYPAAISAGVRLIMASWAIYPALDPAFPAGLSTTVIQSELRGRLGYQGVTITDALEAGALAAFGTPAQRAVLAARAGMDLIMCAARDVTQGQDATAGLAGALDSGQLNPADFAAALQRVTSLRTALPKARRLAEAG